VEQYEKIEPIMESLGFSFKCESDHEMIWQSKGLYLELHKRLVPSYQKDLSPYFEDCWDRAEAAGGGRYVMTPEDEWLYLFTHFAKHFRDGGIGCRHVADLWLFEKTYGKQLNLEYVNQQLTRLQLYSFFRNISDLLYAWFEDGKWNDKILLLTQVIFESGAWGERSAQILAATVRERRGSSSVFGAKVKRLWKATFLPLWMMKQKYPVLEKYPIFLPVFWAVRIVKVLIFTKGKMVQHSREFAYMTARRVDEYQQALNYVGLDFNFEE